MNHLTSSNTLMSGSQLLSGPTNISQSLFMADEKVAEDLGSNLKAFINQSKLSTYFQDNPYGTLSFSDKFQVPTLGGPIIEQSPGHRPGNIYKGSQVFQNSMPNKKSQIKTTDIQGIIVPKNMARW